MLKIKKIVLLTLLMPMLSNAAHQFGIIKCRTPFGASVTAAAVKDVSNNSIWYVMAIPSNANYGSEYNEYVLKNPNATWQQYMTHRFNKFEGIGKQVVTHDNNLPMGYVLGNFEPFSNQPDNNFNVEEAKKLMIVKMFSLNKSIRKGQYDGNYYAREAFKAVGVNHDEIAQLNEQEQLVSLFKGVKTELKNNNVNTDGCILM